MSTPASTTPSGNDAPTWFPDRDALRARFRALTGAGSPYLVGGGVSDAEATAFLRGLVERATRPRSGMRDITYANARAIAHPFRACTDPETAREVRRMAWENADAFDAAGIDLPRWEDLWRKAAAGWGNTAAPADLYPLEPLATQLLDELERQLRVALDAACGARYSPKIKEVVRRRGGDVRGLVDSLASAHNQAQWLRYHAYNQHAVSPEAFGEAAAIQAQTRRGHVQGTEMEEQMWERARPYIRSALRAEGATADEADFVHVVGATNAAIDAARFVAVPSVHVKRANNSNAGELDGVIIDRKLRRVALVIEVKRNPGDLGTARSQREKFVATLRAGAAADDQPAAFVVNGRAGAALLQQVRREALPWLDASLFEHFLQRPVARWMFVSTVGQGTPIPCQLSHHVSRQLGKRLALAGWVPPSAWAVAEDPAVAEAAYRNALDVFDRAPPALFRDALHGLRAAWWAVTKGRPDIVDGLALLEHDYVESAVEASCVGGPPDAVVSLMVVFVELPTTDSPA